MNHSTTPATLDSTWGLIGRIDRHVAETAAYLRRSRERRGIQDDGPPTAADRAWLAAQNTGGTTADADERRAVELTVSALDWTLESIPDSQWDRWAEERQCDDAA